MWANQTDKPLYCTRLWYAIPAKGPSTTIVKSNNRLAPRGTFYPKMTAFGDTAEILDSGEVRCKFFELHINGKCNLRCKECYTLSPIQDWQRSKDQILQSLDLALGKLRPQTVKILGGEPLLHPDTVAILTEVCKRCPHHVELITNGVLLPKHKDRDALLHLHKEYPNLTWTVSDHFAPSGKSIATKLDPVFQPAEIQPLYVCNHFREVSKGLQSSDPFLTYFTSGTRTCPSARCYAVSGSRLYRCARHAARCDLARYGRSGGIPVSQKYTDVVLQWDGIDLETATPMEIRNYLIAQPYGECTLCDVAPRRINQCQMTEKEYNEFWQAFD